MYRNIPYDYQRFPILIQVYSLLSTVTYMYTVPVDLTNKLPCKNSEPMNLKQCHVKTTACTYLGLAELVHGHVESVQQGEAAVSSMLHLLVPPKGQHGVPETHNTETCISCLLIY